MREKFNHLYLDSHERKLLIHSLVELKNQLIQQGRYTDCVDELIFKVINITLINDLQKSIKSNKVISFLGGGAE